MAFCTTCGANVTGTFCSQCGTPAASAAAPPPPPPVQPQPLAAPYVQQPPYAQQPYAQPVPVAAPVARKTSPIVWVLVIVLGLFLLGGIAIAGFVAFVAHRVHQAVAVDGNGVTLHSRGADGKDAVVQFGGSGKLPSWVPVYPGSSGRSQFSVRGSGADGEGGSFVFTTSDDPGRVKSFYTDKATAMGMKINLDTTTPEGGMIVAQDEGDRRSLSVIIGGHTGETCVNVTYGRK